MPLPSYSTNDSEAPIHRFVDDFLAYIFSLNAASISRGHKTTVASSRDGGPLHSNFTGFGEDCYYGYYSEDEEDEEDDEEEDNNKICTSISSRFSSCTSRIFECVACAIRKDVKPMSYPWTQYSLAVVNSIALNRSSSSLRQPSHFSIMWSPDSQNLTESFKWHIIYLCVLAGEYKSSVKFIFSKCPER